MVLINFFFQILPTSYMLKKKNKYSTERIMKVSRYEISGIYRNFMSAC